MKLIKNSAKCLKCGEVLVSKHRHDWVSCSCGSIFIDGGLEYIRCGGDFSLFEDRCEYEEEKPSWPNP